jgi:glycosyltransferase involved in cell wall biosynthesis
MALDALYIAYWSLRDPLFQSQSLPVLRALAREGWRLGAMTFEQPPWRMEAVARAAVRDELCATGIEWHPMVYHKRPAVASTVYDIAAGVSRAVALGRRGGVRLYHGRGTVPTAIAGLAARATGAAFFDDADGPLSEEYADAGVWRRGSIPHRLTRWAEWRGFRSAQAVAVLSEARRQDVAPLARVEVDVLPCAVDTAHFARDEDKGRELRARLGLKGTVLVYSGKSGGWYLGEAVVEFAAAAAAVVGDLTLLVLTTEDPSWFVQRAAARGVRCVVRRASRDEMPAYLSAADAGLSLRAQAPSQRACSPIKNGEYLACGLPVVTTPGAGDYSDLVVRERVGVLLQEVSETGYLGAASELRRLLADPVIRARCREAALKHVDLMGVVVPKYLQTYERLLGRPAPMAAA